MNIKDLFNRNLIKQISDYDAISDLPNDSKFYVGFDPTNSLHVGHLLPIITMKRLQMTGAKPIAIIGGATAKVGDPTNRTESRPILSDAQIEQNIQNVTSTIRSIVDCEIVNNVDFVKSNFVEFAFDIGRHFSVNQMLNTDTYKTKLKTGLSFLEFSYALLQANDFLQLSRQDCFVQIGGNDQWANMVAGIHLIHAKDKKQAYCITLPILEDKNGVKFGKSAGNAVWLDKEKTSVFDFWQFWRNVSDDMVLTLLKYFTFLSLDEINHLVYQDINNSKIVLASIVTSIVHGEQASQDAQFKAKQLFAGGTDVDIDPVVVSSGKTVSEILQIVGATPSKSEGLRLIKGGGVKISGVVVQNDFSPTGTFILEKGKKSKFKIEIKNE